MKLVAFTALMSAYSQINTYEGDGPQEAPLREEATPIVEPNLMPDDMPKHYSQTPGGIPLHNYDNRYYWQFAWIINSPDHPCPCGPYSEYLGDYGFFNNLPSECESFGPFI